MPDCCRKTLIYIHTVHLLLQIDESDTNSMVLKNDFLVTPSYLLWSLYACTVHAIKTARFLKSMLKARSVWPQTCLDLHYLDGGPHPVQSLQSVCPGMPPLTAILPWDNRELFGKGDKINTPSADYPPAILGPLAWLCVQSIKEPSV